MKLPKEKTIKARLAIARLWERWRVTIFAGLITLAAIIGAAYFVGTLEEHQGEAQKAAIARQAADLAGSVSGEYARVFEAVGGLVNPVALVPVFRSGDPERMREAAAELAAARPGVLGVRLLPPGTNREDYASKPPLTFASLDMLERAEREGKPPRPEVQLMGTPDQQVVSLWQVADADGKLVGYVLFSLDVAMLQKALDEAPFPGGYAEVRQPVAKAKPVLLAKRGRPQHGQSLVEPLQGTSWDLVFMPPVEGGGSVRGALGGIALWVGVGVIVLGALAGVVVVLRRRSGAPAASPTFGGAIGGLGQEAQGSVGEMVEAVLARSGPEEEPAGTPKPQPAVGETAATDQEEDRIPANIFRTYDIRGVVGKTLSADIARAIGQSIGSEAYRRGQQTIVVGRDGRTTSPELAGAIIEGLRASGRDVIDLGLVPTPVMYFATHFLETQSGVMVTGSHNPPEYNGFKIVLGDETLSGDAVAGLRARILSGDLESGAGSLQSMDMGSEYIRGVSEDIPVALGSAYKLVVDCGNGSAAELAPRLYRALGHDVVELFCTVDGRFPNHHPDPTQPENLQDLIAAVKEQQADLGFAFDGDGDRLVVVDGEGSVIWPDRLMMLYARDVLSRNPGAQIIYDVKCSSLLGKVIAKLGGKPLMWKTGHALMKAKLRETGALLAGEGSGHVIIKERWYDFDDALYAGARLLELLQAIGGKPTDAFARLPTGVITPELRVAMPEGAPYRLMQRLPAESAFPGAKLTTIDGVRADYPDGWGLVRASNTTPSLILRFEGNDQKALERIQGVFRKVLLELQPDLQLPF